MCTSHVNPIRLGLRLVLLVVLSTIAVPAWAQPAPPPRVRLIATGGTQGQALNEALGKGVFVVTGTRTGSGRIAAEDLAAVKARILLMLALAQTRDPAEIQRMFTQY